MNLITDQDNQSYRLDNKGCVRGEPSKPFPSEATAFQEVNSTEREVDSTPQSPVMILNRTLFLNELSCFVGNRFLNEDADIVRDFVTDECSYFFKRMIEKGIMQPYDSQPQESSESSTEWYNRLKNCARAIYLYGYPINRTCEYYCMENCYDEQNMIDKVEKKMIDKFYNMNSDGFKEHLNGLRENCPYEDPSYLLDLVLCAHVRNDYSFDLSKSNDPGWREFEKERIDKIRQNKSLIIKEKSKEYVQEFLI